MKYYSPDLIKFIKHDAKKIKYKTDKFKNSEILNVLANFFGWRHFNELSKNAKNIDYKTVSFLTLSKMNYKELENFKNNYKKHLKEKLLLSDNSIKKLNSFILNIKTKKFIYINNNKEGVFEIDLNDYYIELNNQEVKEFFITLLKKDNDMWSYKTFKIFNDIKNIVHDIEKESINYQESMKYFLNSKNLIKYIKQNIKKEDLILRYKNIGGLPAITELLKSNSNNDKNIRFYEHYGYLSMRLTLSIFMDKISKNKIKITLDDLKNKLIDNKDKNIIIYNNTNDGNYDLMNSFLKKQLLSKPKYYGKRKKQEINKILKWHNKKYNTSDLWFNIFTSLLNKIPKELFFSVLNGNKEAINIISHIDNIYLYAKENNYKDLIERLELIPGFNQKTKINDTAQQQYEYQMLLLEYIKSKNNNNE